MISLLELNSHGYPTTPEIDKNLATLLERLNKVREGYGIPMTVTSGLRSDAQQAALIAETIKKQDVVICTALIPGRAAPRLVTEDMLRSMKPGAVVVDLAVEQGGNCALSETGKIVEALDGKTWNRTGSLNVFLYARKLYKEANAAN